MKTEDLIAQLAADAAPVRRLRSPSRRLAGWLIAALVATAAGVLLFGVRSDVADAAASPRLVAWFALTVGTAVAAAAAALVLGVPGLDRSPAARWLPIVLLLGWSAALAGALVASGEALPRLAAMPVHQLCVIQIALLAMMPAAASFVLLRRAAPLRGHWASGLAALSGLALGAAGTQLLCPLNDPAHQLVGHVAPVALAALATAAVGPAFVLRAAWTRRAISES